MHAGEFAIVGFCDVYVERLALVNIGPSVGGHLDHSLLGDLPHGLVQILDVLRDIIHILRIISGIEIIFFYANNNGKDQPAQNCVQTVISTFSVCSLDSITRL